MTHTYKVDYGFGIIHDTDTTDFEKALLYADDHCAYSQRDFSVTLDDEVIATRYWVGVGGGFDEEEDPIDFGSFGYYTSWQG